MQEYLEYGWPISAWLAHFAHGAASRPRVRVGRVVATWPRCVHAVRVGHARARGEHLAWEDSSGTVVQ